MTLAFLYMFLTGRYCISIYDNKHYEAYEQINFVISINGSLLTIVLLIMTLMIMHRLKNRFHGLYTDYGKKLWIILIVQVVSLAISTIF